MWDKVITSKKSIWNIDIKQLIDYRDLLVLLVKRNFMTTYKQTILGPLWYLIQPICSTIMYTIVFGTLAGLSTDGIPQPLFYLSGTMLWTYFSNGVSQIAGTFNENKGLFGKVYFPRLIAPLATAIEILVKLGVQLSLFVVVLIYYVISGFNFDFSYKIIFIPFIIMWIGVLSIGIGLIVSAVTTKYRDLMIVLTFFLQLLMYGTPVVYPMSTITGKLKYILLINPMSAPMESFRWCIFGTAGVSSGIVAYSIVISIVLFLLGVLSFNRTERTFVDVI